MKRQVLDCGNVFAHLWHRVYISNTRGTPKKWNLFFKNCVFILTCLNFSHLQITLHVMHNTYQHIFFHCSKLFLNSSILMPFCASAIFCFTSPTEQNISLWGPFFHPGNKTKLLGERSGEEGGWGTGVMPFLVENSDQELLVQHSVQCEKVHS